MLMIGDYMDWRDGFVEMDYYLIGSNICISTEINLIKDIQNRQ